MEVLNVLAKAAGVYWPCFWKSVPMFGLTDRDIEDWLGDDFFFFLRRNVADFMIKW